MPVTTRRQNGVSPPLNAQSESPPKRRATANTNTMLSLNDSSPSLPNLTEAILLAVYPLTLAIGSAFSHFSPRFQPPATKATYSHIHQSYQPADQAPSYFAQKRNVFNVYFVKIGWFWCTLALLVFVALSSRGRKSTAASTRRPSKPRTRSRTSEQDEADDSETDDTARADGRLRRSYQTVFRYLLATLVWILTTQWCFGAPLIDRGFRLTGGVCAEAAQELANPNATRAKELEAAATHAACKLVRGQWRGGHDISGHVFLLVLGSGMVFLEIAPFLAARSSLLFGVSGGRVVRRANGEVAPLASPPDEVEPSPLQRTSSSEPGSLMATLKVYATTLALGTGLLSWWMLMMTAAFFHTWLEKTTGFLLAAVTLWSVYFLPRAVPGLRAIIGMPGV